MQILAEHLKHGYCAFRFQAVSIDF